jgi:hypothetical protein
VLSNARHRTWQLEHERDLLRQDYCRAMASNDRDTKRTLDVRFQELHARWRAALADELAAREELTKAKERNR